jgi:tRNA(Leu) C34 or U34 (ribose-2'-O)-methylase TrmL
LIYLSVAVSAAWTKADRDSATEHCDDQITIPQFGMVESLNMLTAAVAIYESLRQHSWTAT